MAKEKAKSGKSEGEQEGLLSKEEMDDLAVLDNDPGGPLPSKSVMKLGSYKKEIANQFKEEEEAIFSVHARCEFVGFGGGKRIQDFDVLDIFQEEDLDVDIVERFKDMLEDYDAPAKTKKAIEAFLDSCVADVPAPEGGEPQPEEPKAEEEPADDGGKPDAPAPAAEEPQAAEGGEPPAEEVDGEIVSEGDDAAMGDAAGDLDWSDE